ncbi:hypothetical protein PM04_01030 [Thalassobacter sp. 16PALIMAR09]|nr:hypothetical protein PM04_01030 [Thalassobacter sp. 16PALIMAR09]
MHPPLALDQKPPSPGFRTRPYSSHDRPTDHVQRHKEQERREHAFQHTWVQLMRKVNPNWRGDRGHGDDDRKGRKVHQPYGSGGRSGPCWAEQKTNRAGHRDQQTKARRRANSAVHGPTVQLHQRHRDAAPADPHQDAQKTNAN